MTLYIVSVVLFTISTLLFVSTAVKAGIMRCHKLNCTKYGVQWICGSDGKDYLNRCELNRMRCFGLAVEELSAGKCAEHKKRMLEKRRALQNQFDPRRCTRLNWEDFKRTALLLWTKDFLAENPVKARHAANFDDQVVDYQFDLMDLNVDEKISFSEWQQQVHRSIDPRVDLEKRRRLQGRCPKQWLRECDADRSRAVSRAEWRECFGGWPSAVRRSPVQLHTPIQGILVHPELLQPPTTTSATTTYHRRPFTEPPVHRARTLANPTIPLSAAVDQAYETHGFRSDPCHGQRKKTFLQIMFAMFKTDMFNQGLVTEGSMAEGRQQAARWKFNELDKDKDGFLHHTEYHGLRKLIRNWSGVKKCSRSFVRMCDTNRDKRISAKEWDVCTINAYQNVTDLPKSDRNPFLYLLKPNQ